MTQPATPLKKAAAALAFAARKHKHQCRKDAEHSPYINHPIDLFHLLCVEADIDDPEVLCGAILHDILEDTDTCPEQLEALFGSKVTNIVKEVSDDMRLPKRQRWHLQIEKAPKLSPEAKLVKLADKICNLRDLSRSPPPHWDRQRLRAYFDWAKDVVDRIRGTHPKLERLFDQAYAHRP